MAGAVKRPDFWNCEYVYDVSVRARQQDQQSEIENIG